MTSTDVTEATPKRRTQLDDYTCGIIIGRYLANQKLANIQRDMGIPRSTITDCINRWKKTGTGTIKPRTGRPKKFPKKD